MNSFGSIISKYRKQNNMTQQELASVLKNNGFNISGKAVSAWESGQANPPVDTFFELCSIFRIKDIYEELYGTNPFSKDTITEGLNALGKARVEEYIGFLLQDSRFSHTSVITPVTSRRFIRLYDMPVSAGTGNFLEESTYEEVERTESIPENASFGVKISGDSMEPMFTSGQTVWVKEQNTLNNGEIGIFLLDGNAYCKKLQKTKNGVNLLSLNKAYSPIPVCTDSDLIVFGKVL